MCADYLRDRFGSFAGKTFSLFFFNFKGRNSVDSNTDFFFFIGKSFLDKIRHSVLSQLELLYQQLSVSVCSHFYNTVFLCVNV